LLRLQNRKSYKENESVSENKIPARSFFD
jgi:hypothetical protein